MRKASLEMIGQMAERYREAGEPDQGYRVLYKLLSATHMSVVTRHGKVRFMLEDVALHFEWKS